MVLSGIGGAKTLGRYELWLCWLWFVSVAWTLLTFAFPATTTILTVLAGIVLVGFALLCLPSLALYLTAGLPLYFILRRVNRPVAAVVAIALVTALGFAIPIAANSRLKQRIAIAAQADHGGKLVGLNSRQTLAILAFHDPKWTSTCEEVCHRLLLSGSVASVMLGDVAALGTDRPVERYWLEEASPSCATARIITAAGDKNIAAPAPSAQPRSSGVPGKSPKCIAHAQATLRAADVVFARWEPIIPGAAAWGFASPGSWLREVDFYSVSAIFQRGEGRWRRTMRRSFFVAHGAGIPLLLAQPMILDSHGPGGWVLGPLFSVGQTADPGLSRFLEKPLPGCPGSSHEDIGRHGIACSGLP